MALNLGLLEILEKFIEIDANNNVKLKPKYPINFTGQPAMNFVIENRTDDPASAEVGRIWLRVDL